MFSKESTSSAIKILVIILILNVMIFSVYAVLFYQIKEKNESYSLLKTKLVSKTSKNIEFRSLKNILNETASKRNKINSFFIPKEEGGVAYFIENLEKLAEDNGLSLKINSILLQKTSGKVLQNVFISLRVKGRWGGMIKFVRLLEVLPYKVDFKRVSLLKESNNLKTSKHSKKDYDWNGVLELNILKLKNNL